MTRWAAPTDSPPPEVRRRVKVSAHDRWVAECFTLGDALATAVAQATVHTVTFGSRMAHDEWEAIRDAARAWREARR